MRSKRFTEEQIDSIMKESVADRRTEEICRQHGICTNTFYRWKAKYADMDISDVRKLKALEDENARLKKIVAEQVLDIQALKAVLSKKV
jgi:putative transposase